MADALAGFTRESFEAEARPATSTGLGTGPAVIVISEVPGITPLVAEFARKVAAEDCTAVMPHLFGVPGAPPTGGYTMKTLAGSACHGSSRCWRASRRAPSRRWLRALATAEHARCGGPGVGAVGMCLTGGFALAMMVDDTVVAPVVSQPSLPFPIGRRAQGRPRYLRPRPRAGQEAGRRRDLPARAAVQQRPSQPPGAFRHAAPRARRRLHQRRARLEPGQPARSSQEAHSVLTEHLDDREGTPTRAALDQVLDFFAQRLHPPGGDELSATSGP